MSVTLDLQVACEGAVPSEADFLRWTQAALSSESDAVELSVRLVDTDESAALNQQYRQKEGATNVLSFPFESPIELSPRLIGDLVICAPIMRAEAVAQGKQEADHWAHLTVHGCLHLLGHDHIEDAEAVAMETLEVTVLAGLNIANPYREVTAQ